MAKKKYATNKGLRKLCGCKRRSWPECAHPYYINFRGERGSLHTQSYADAQVKLAELRAAIMNRTYVRPSQAPAASVVDQMPTFETVAGYYRTGHVEVKLGDGAGPYHDGIVRFLGRVALPCGLTFAQKPFRLITQEDVEIAIAAKRAPSVEIVTRGEQTWTRRTGGHVTANRLQSHLAAIWNWASQPKRGYADKTPLSFGGRVPDELKKTKEHGRDRRLQPGEEAALIQHAGPHLRDCIVAALEAGTRKEELLSLQWKHVRWLQNEIALDAANTKTDRARQIPISPALREVLTRRLQAHPKDTPWRPEHYVFGDEVGGRVQDIRTAWDNAVLKAHGVTVARGHGGRVSAENRVKLQAIDLHFHDLRHEAGSRKLEAGWPLHAVSRWLGHTKLTTTDTYLNATTRLLHELNERTPLALVGR